MAIDGIVKEDIIAFYQEERTKTLRRLEHINQTLSQLGDTSVKLGTAISSDSTASKPKKSTPKRKYNKKRGPKPFWDKLVVKTLKNAGRPLSYDEITNFVMISEGRPESRRATTKASVQNTVFKLRQSKKVDTFGLGSRTKYIAPSDWFEDGEIKEEYKQQVNVKRAPSKPGPKPKKRGPGRPPGSKNKKSATASKKAKSAKKVAAPKAEATKATPKPVAPKKPTKAKKAKAAPKKAALKKATPKKTAAKKVAPKASAKKAAPKAKKTPKAAAKRSTAKPSAKPAVRKVAMKKTVKKK